MKKKDIMDAWAEIRGTNNTIPDEVLDFMKNSALDALTAQKLVESYCCINNHCKQCVDDICDIGLIDCVNREI